ncbi:MAG: TlpA disulfide reductase family protein [Dysgonomonas sp.]|nr:TlpA disulfide reductase family protein [Dysgonomonas sp.]
MKKMLGLLALIIYASSVSSQGISLINGIWERGKLENIKLFNITNGTLGEIASSKVSDDGKFTFAFTPEKEGYYAIGKDKNMINRYIFYFKPGDQLNVKVAPKNYELFGENSAENKEMARWHDFIQPLEDKTVYYLGKNSTYVDFFPLFDEKMEELNSYQINNTPNIIFNTSFEEFKKFDLLFIALTFLHTPRTAHPQGEDFPDFYRNIDLSDLTKTTAILNYPEGVNLLMKGIYTGLRLNEDISNEEKASLFAAPHQYILNTRLPEVINDTIKGELTLMFAGNNKTFEGFMDFKQKYSKYVITDDQKKRLEKREKELNNNNAQERPAYNFTFPDMSGKNISLSDFKGKIVYIDLWATWCGPCKQQIPYLKDLEKEYHGKNIVFIGISVDVLKDKQKWADFVKKEELSGIQLFGGNEAKDSIMKEYQIKGIPRFILVNKDGNLISADAPKPSSPEIRPVLNAALK